MADTTRIIAYPFGPVETTSATTTTLGTIDGTNLRGITQNYAADVELRSARFSSVGASYYGNAVNLTCGARRQTGNVTVYNGTAVLNGGGVTDLKLTASGTDILVQVVTDHSESMEHYVWCIFRVSGDDGT